MAGAVGRPFVAALFRLIGGEAKEVADVGKEVDRAEQLRPSRGPNLERREERVEHDLTESPIHFSADATKFRITQRTRQIPASHY